MHASLLCTILTDRRLARMVKTLIASNFDRSCQEAISEIDPEKTWRPDELFPGSLPSLRNSQRLGEGALRTRIQILEEALCQCTLVTQSQRRKRLEKLHRGSEELAAILLLWYLPALRSMVLHFGSTDWTDIYALLFRIVEYAVTASRRPTSTKIHTGLPLQNLHRVYLVFRGSRSDDVALVRAFLSLPCLSVLNCRGLSGNSVTEATPTYARRLAEASAVKSLDFQDCILDIAALLGLLGGVTAVTRFAYTWLNGKNVSDDYGWVKFGPSAIVGALVGSISHRLEELELCAWGCCEMQHVDISVGFRDFCLLKSLDISTNIMYAPKSSDLSSFVFMLPERLERLTLVWIKSAPVPDVRTLVTFLKDLGDHAKVHLKSLRTVKIFGYFDVDESAELPAEDVKTRRRSIGHLKLSVINNECYR